YVYDGAKWREDTAGSIRTLIDKLVEDLKNEKLVVPDDLKGEEQEQNKVAPWGFKASEYQQVNHQFKEKQEQAQPQAQNIQ
ncbi:hypothetical protein IDG46_30660, partial [Staphylococcus sp. EG-SA-13]|nr:hypothetical protein [Staphylococcus sp. EG-SA-13]